MTGVVLRGGGFVVVATVRIRMSAYPPLEAHHPWYNRFAAVWAVRGYGGGTEGLRSSCSIDSDFVGLLWPHPLIGLFDSQ